MIEPVRHWRTSFKETVDRFGQPRWRIAELDDIQTRYMEETYPHMLVWAYSYREIIEAIQAAQIPGMDWWYSGGRFYFTSDSEMVMVKLVMHK